MGFLSKWNKKTKEKVKESEGVTQGEQREAEHQLEELLIKKVEPVKTETTLIDESCDLIMEATYQLEDLQMEYQLVTAYLTDIQKIEQIPVEEKEKIKSVAEKIVALSEERTKFQKNEKKITRKQSQILSRYEEEIPRTLEKMGEYEEYNSKLKSDMMHLEGEKGEIDYVEKNIVEQRKNLKMVSISVAIMVLIAMCLFAGLSFFYEAALELALVATIFVGALAGTIIYMKYRRLELEYKLEKKRRNRAISVLNKVKVKYVNNTNGYQYLCEKFDVRSQRELQFLWQEYTRQKEEEKRYRYTTSELTTYQDELVKLLAAYKLHDTYIWLQQAIALIDSKEMVEITHHLNTRRQKLREQMEFNEAIKAQGFKEIEKLVKANPELKKYVIDALAAYHLNIS